jgi:hypothetical protein
VNKDIKNQQTKPGPSKYIFLHYYEELWTNGALQENDRNTENIEVKIITMEQSKEGQKWKVVSWR